MARKRSIIPTDISSSREYYGLNNSQDIYKGTSFKFSGDWVANTHYFNDEYIVDFVTYTDPVTSERSLWACKRNHLSVNPPSMNSREWTYVMSGTEGAPGQIYVPRVDNDGNLVFTLSDEPAAATINIAAIKGEDGADGQDGSDGADGKVYIPSVKDGIMTFTLSDSGRAEYRVSVNDFKGEKGDSGKPIEIKTQQENGFKVLYYREEGSSSWIKAGNVGGDPGKSPKLTVWFDDNNDIRDDQIRWGYDGVPVSEWSILCYLDELRGDSITGVELDERGHLEITTSYKRRTESGEQLMESSKYKTEGSVFPSFKHGYTHTLSPEDDAYVSLNKTGFNEYDINFAIPKGKQGDIGEKGEKGDPGDQNVYIGCDEPEDKDLIWYNPCEQTINGMSAIDVLYSAYLQTPGKRIETQDGGFSNVWLTQDLFEKAIGNISPINGFEVRVKSSFQDLGEPTRDKLGFIYLIPSSGGTNDMFEEWIVIDSPETVVGEEHYVWERWGSSALELDNYYTKDQVAEYVDNAIDQIITSFNGGEIDASNWV